MERSNTIGSRGLAVRCGRGVGMQVEEGTELRRVEWWAENSWDVSREGLGWRENV